jgi:hypothetical protein
MNITTRVAILFLVLATNAGAATINFGCITNNDPSGSSCAIAESQMTLDMEASGVGQVLFTFSNTGAFDSSIADVYFYDNLGLLAFNSILNPETGVRFGEGAQPSHLPGYNVTPNFSAGADSGGRRHGRRWGSHRRGGRGNGSSQQGGIYQNGINPGESLGILFDLNAATYDDAFAALISGDLAIGIHAQGLGYRNEFSESLISAIPPAVVPVPAAAWLFGSGLLVLFSGLRKRSS